MECCTSTTCAYGRTCVPSVIQQAPIAFLCEAPGFRELQQLTPLVGPAGTLFNKLISYAGLARRDVSLINACGCVDLEREDRRPLPAEIDACRPRVLADIAAADPKIIFAMGNVSQGMFFPGSRVGQIHGKVRAWTDPSGQTRLVVPCYHPAAALGHRSPALQQVIIDDIRGALALLS